MIGVNELFSKKKKVEPKYPELNPKKLEIPKDMTVEEIYKILGRQAKGTIKNLQPLLHFIKKHTHSNVASISQTAQPLIAEYGAQPNVNRNLKKLIETNIIRKADCKFSNGQYGQMYTVNVNNLQSIYHITHNNISISISKSEPEVDIPVNIHFGKIRKADNMRDFSDTGVRRKADEIYPQLKYYQEIAEKLNLKEEDDDYVIRFEPQIERNEKGMITNVSIRATSDFCSRKSREKHPNLPWYFKCREDYLDETLGPGWEEYDVKGSVPRIAHFLYTGEWLDADKDPYEEIFKAHWFTGDKETRDMCKDWFMRIYFGGTVKQIVAKAIRSNEYPNMTKDKKEEITDYITELKEAIDEYCGPADGNSIFLHESCIYLGVREELAKRKIPVVQVYDGFFFRHGEVPKDMADIIRNSAVYYYNTYISI